MDDYEFCLPTDQDLGKINYETTHPGNSIHINILGKDEPRLFTISETFILENSFLPFDPSPFRLKYPKNQTWKEREANLRG